MATKYIQRRIEHLRQQPDAARLRAASLLTLGTGGFLLVLWVTVLLPLQIRLNSNSEEQAPVVATQPTVSPNVAGLSTVTPAPTPFPSRRPLSTIAPSATPLSSILPLAPDVSSRPVELQP